MKVQRITVHEYIGDNPPTESIFLFNDDCQLVQEILPSKEVHHRYQPNGKEFEELTYFSDGAIRRIRFEYDEEGDYVGEECRDGDGRIIYKRADDWLKPGRVVSSESVWDDKSIFSFRRYLHKDERQAFIRGEGFYCTFEYDEEGNLVCEKLVCDAEDINEPARNSIRRYNKDGLLIGETDQNGVSSTREYEFDEYGNWIRVEGRIEDGPISLIAIRELVYVPGAWNGWKFQDCHSLIHVTHNLKFTET